jgi:putative ABC transport system permease protein
MTTAVLGLTTHKSRSLLTILGIVIGITAIMIVQSVGNGAQNLILNQIRDIGSNIVVVHPGRQPKGMTDMMSEIFLDSLKQKDLEILKRPGNVPDLTGISPFVMTNAVVTYQTEGQRTNILGTAEVAAEILNWHPEVGQFFSNEEISTYAQVAVIGSKIKQDLFGSDNPVGQMIKIKGQSFRVIGILPAKGSTSLVNIDESIVAPYTAVQKYLSGTNYFFEFIVRVKDEAAVPYAIKDITATLRLSHNITDPAKDDFHTHTPEDLMQTIGSVTTILTALLSSVAAISLVVGGVGIMNIMLVSVTERTKEIGLRKALGATNIDILRQFLAESVILTSLGGILGIVFGFSLSYLISFTLKQTVTPEWPFVISFSSILLGIAVSGIVGLVFGMYPARKASQKHPIEALRYE